MQTTGVTKEQFPTNPLRGRYKTFCEHAARYALTSGLLLLAKLCLTYLLIQWLNAFVAYFVAHIAIFFLSYSLHTRVTFRKQFSRTGIKRYFTAVILFKLFDYTMFNLLFVTLRITASWCVLLASAAEAGLRFLVVRKALHPDTGIDPSPNQSPT